MENLNILQESKLIQLIDCLTKSKHYYKTTMQLKKNWLIYYQNIKDITLATSNYNNDFALVIKIRKV